MSGLPYTLPFILGGDTVVGASDLKIYPPGPATTLGRQLMLEHIDPLITYSTLNRSRIFHLSGALVPWPRYQDGLTLLEMTPPTPGFKHLDSQGAREDGTTWNDTVYDPMEITAILSAAGTTPEGTSRVVSDWVSSNNPKVPGRLEWVTFESGLWWCNPRLQKVWTDRITRSPRRMKKQILTHVWRVDHAFWYGIDSTATFQPGGTGGSGHLLLTNIGEMDGWPTMLAYGPGMFEFGNGPSNAETIKFGPLLDGQVVLITTLPRLRSVVDLTPNLPPQELSGLQELIDMLIKLVTFNQVPPLLTWFESLFGIRPPQGVLYSLLEGRFSRPIPGVEQPSDAKTAPIVVKISGGNSSSKVIASVTPRRRWPE